MHDPRLVLLTQLCGKQVIMQEGCVSPLCKWVQVRAAGLTLPAVIAARAMVGLGEGVALPSMNNLVRLLSHYLQVMRKHKAHDAIR